ncbi:LlaMI family restriction endonuclease [Metamycoplasma subdolum]|nr:LlaMI family restriction endonuclease [Metamycoplasma subdolum]
MMTDKEKIINLFYSNVKGKKPNIKTSNINHDGKYGHWLELQFGLKANDVNEPDLLGYELKSDTKAVTSFGDWSANMYIFNNEKYKEIFQGQTNLKRRDKFLTIFGMKNISKLSRFSWSGLSCPKINHFNSFGQKLLICENKDIIVVYSFSKDMRVEKEQIVPRELQQEDLILAIWYGEKFPANYKFKYNEKTLKNKVEDKFNKQGWFTCKKNSEGEYTKICFGPPIDYNLWLEKVKLGIVYFDSGMHTGNSRPYQQWRAKNEFWDSMINEEY